MSKLLWFVGGCTVGFVAAVAMAELNKDEQNFMCDDNEPTTPTCAKPLAELEIAPEGASDPAAFCVPGILATKAS